MDTSHNDDKAQISNTSQIIAETHMRTLLMIILTDMGTLDLYQLNSCLILCPMKTNDVR